MSPTGTDDTETPQTPDCRFTDERIEEERTLSMGKKKTLRDHASTWRDTLAPHVENARDKAGPALADARDKAVPVLAGAAAKAVPVLVDARDKAAPYLADARDKAAPYLDEARDKAAPVLGGPRQGGPVLSEARDRFTTDVLPVVTAALTALDTPPRTPGARR